MRIAQIALLPVKCEFIEGELVGEDRDSDSRMDDCILALSKISRSEILSYVQNAIYTAGMHIRGGLGHQY
jgi:hypothetical protein